MTRLRWINHFWQTYRVWILARRAHEVKIGICFASNLSSVTPWYSCNARQNWLGVTIANCFHRVWFLDVMDYAARAFVLSRFKPPLDCRHLSIHLGCLSPSFFTATEWVLLLSTWLITIRTLVRSLPLGGLFWWQPHSDSHWQKLPFSHSSSSG